MESSFKIQKSTKPKLYESESLFRCSECLFIPFIKIIFENGKIYIETKCENSHLNKIEINNYLKTINSYNIKCYSCKKNNIELNYWPEVKNALIQINLIQNVKKILRIIQNFVKNVFKTNVYIVFVLIILMIN